MCRGTAAGGEISLFSLTPTTTCQAMEELKRVESRNAMSRCVQEVVGFEHEQRLQLQGHAIDHHPWLQE